MGLQEGMKERFHWELHNTTDVLVTDGGFSSTCKNSMDVKEGDRHLSYWKDSSVHSKIHIFFSTLLFAIVLIVENITNFIKLENCKSSVSFYWIQSCVIVFSFRFWGRKRNRSFRSQEINFRPLLFYFVATATFFGLDFNHSTFGISAGSESYLISLALVAPLVLIASWLTGRHAYPDKIILLVAASSSLVMILFCSFEDRPAHYRMSFNHGAFGLLMGMSLAFFIVQAKRCLSKLQVSISQLLYLLNFSCIICLPFIALLCGELPYLEKELLKRGALELIFSILILALLRLASQTACLYHLKHSTPLLNATVRGFSWIWITLYITLHTPGERGSLVVPVLAAFWLYGLFIFFPALLTDFFLIF
ncbi:uncharacterized protein [Pocillopora verrucosa]|uniref:uncharacterized protein n=1 Tax=Pocillopora verrucosa TaxID=203993 RepID=UPI003340E330